MKAELCKSRKTQRGVSLIELLVVVFVTLILAALASPNIMQVVYNTRDEGLHFPAGYDEPMRRVRYQKRETLQWRNPTTGASLRISYPSEQVSLVPVTGQ